MSYSHFASKCTAYADDAVYFNATAMLLNDALCNCQAEPAALTLL